MRVLSQKEMSEVSGGQKPNPPVGNCDRHKNTIGKGHYEHGKGHGYGHYKGCHDDAPVDE